MDNFFSFDPNAEGFQLHKTEAEARKAANDALDGERAIADSDGWDEDVFKICWGKISQIAKETEAEEGLVSMFCDSRTTNCELVDL